MAKRIAQKIKAFRRSNRLLQHDLSDYMLIDKQRISLLETGNANPTLRTLVGLAIIMDIELKKLLE